MCRCFIQDKPPHAHPRLVLVEGSQRVELPIFTANASGYWNLVVLEDDDIHIHHVRVSGMSERKMCAKYFSQVILR